MCKQQNVKSLVVLTQQVSEESSIYGRPQKSFQGGNVDILLTLFRLLTMHCKRTFTKRFTLSTLQSNYPRYGNSRKNAICGQ